MGGRACALLSRARGEVQQGCPQGTETNHGWRDHGKVHRERRFGSSGHCEACFQGL